MDITTVGYVACPIGDSHAIKVKDKEIKEEVPGPPDRSLPLLQFLSDENALAFHCNIREWNMSCTTNLVRSGQVNDRKSHLTPTENSKSGFEKAKI